MAQHIPIASFPHIGFRQIEQRTRAAFKRSYGMHTSSLYRYIDVQDGNEVYQIERTIPAGIVWGSNRGVIEIHFDPKTREVKHMYLVA